MSDRGVNVSVALATLLADGRFRSGTSLAASLGISRAAIWKRIAKLADLGLDVETCRSVGYRLREPLDLLDENLIEQYLAEFTPPARLSIEIRRQVDSTNKILLERARNSELTGLSFLLAEQQLDGRGRRGRHWLSPFGRNLYLSALWKTDHGLQGLDGLSLAVGVALASTLKDDFSVPATLKWPNDILVAGRKIGGILLEVEGDLSGPLSVVIGIGLNINMPDALVATIDQPATDMQHHSVGHVSRNRVAAAVVARLSESLDLFDRKGFAAFRDLWVGLDALSGAEVEIITPSGPLSGTARGVDQKGALLVEAAGRISAIVAGDLSLRARS